MNRKMLITGGAGFIGVNSARYFIDKGWDVTVLDDLSRKGADKNLKWLKETAGRFNFEKIDIRNYYLIETLFRNQRFNVVLHLASQVAVTTSIINPRTDFEINVLGTFNILEAIRQHNPDAFMIYASTNKVYGNMEDIKMIEKNGRYEYANFPNGISEDRPLDFHSPYGCSKGAAEQYVIDYARIYDLQTVSFRQSCIYGPRQFGVEDQGWVAWFIIASVLGKPIMIYGDGKQIRDVLYVDDLISAYEASVEKRDKVSGEAFNIGGGPQNTLSLLELIGYLEEELGVNIEYSFDDWRPGDQRVFVCNLSKAKNLLEWEPQIRVQSGVVKFINWVRDNKGLF